MANYVITKDFRTPHIVMTGNPRNPTKIVEAKFKKGTIVTNGELICDDKKRPLFLLVRPDMQIPLVYLKEVVTKDIKGNTESRSAVSGNESSQPAPTITKSNLLVNKKTKYIDGAILGGLIGIGIGYMAEKKQWFGESTNAENKWYAAGVGALLGIYMVYRLNTREVIKTQK